MIRKRRKKADPILAVAREARRQKREMNKYLSGAVSEALGFSVTVRVNLTPSEPMSPEMKKAKRMTKAQVRRMFGTLSQSPL